MARDQEVQFEQDRLGNERRKLDALRAQEGNAGGFDNGEGLAEMGSAETGSAQTVYSAPTRANAVYLTRVWGYNSVGSGNNTFHLVDGDAHGNGFSNTTRRTVDIEVASSNTRAEPINAKEFTNDIGVVTDFQGQVGVEIVVDHKQDSESASEVTGTPS